MWSLILRFLPSLAGGASAFLNPWVLVAGMAAVTGVYFYGRHDGEKSLTIYQAQQEAVTAAQNAKNAQIITDHKRAKEQADETYQRDLSRLSADLDIADERLRAARTKVSQRLVPAAPAGSAGNLRICFTRETLDRELGGAINRVVERHAKRNLQLAAEGQRGINVAKVCQEWAAKVR